MPIEIKELIIRTKISPPEEQQNGQSGNLGSTNQEAANQVVEKAVNEVLDILKHKNER
jgi:hypothetical protein